MVVYEKVMDVNHPTNPDLNQIAHNLEILIESYQKSGFKLVSVTGGEKGKKETEDICALLDILYGFFSFLKNEKNKKKRCVIFIITHLL